MWYHIIINDNTKQITISQSLKSYGCGRDFKNFTIYGHGNHICHVAVTVLTFLSKGKEWPSYHNFLQLPKQICLCRKKVQDQPKVIIWTYLVVLKYPMLRGGIKKFWASGIFPIQIVQCFTPNVQKCVRYWLHLGSYCWLSLFSHNTWSKIHTPIELAKWTKLSTERW